MSQALSLNDVAVELEVHYMTIYRYVRLGLLPASKVGRMWQVLPQDLEEFRTEGSRAGGANAGSKHRQTNWHRRYVSRLIAGDQAGAWSVIEAARLAGYSSTDVYLEMMTPAMHHLGERWASDEAGIGEEHQATTIVRRHVGRLSPQFTRRGRSRGTVLVGCPPGERHDIGLSMIADLLRAAGYEVADLGADVPVDSFIEAAQRLRSQLVAVGISVHDRDLLWLADKVAINMGQLASQPLVMVGGNGISGPGSDQDPDARVNANYVIGRAHTVVGLIDTHRRSRAGQQRYVGGDVPDGVSSTDVVE